MADYFLEHNVEAGEKFIPEIQEAISVFNAISELGKVSP